MTSCGSCSVSLALLALACASAPQKRAAPLELPPGRIGILPLDNLSGVRVPASGLRTKLEARLTERGAPLIPRGELDAFLSRHRFRWSGGVSAELMRAASLELGAAGLVVTQVTSFQEQAPPHIGLAARLVVPSPAPRIDWLDERFRAGDDSPGLFELGLVNDVAALEDDVIARVVDSLVGAVAGTKPVAPRCRGDRFDPQSSFRSAGLIGHTASVAVLPFVNETQRRGAGDVVALELVRHLRARGFAVVEPGVVRERLLEFRLATDEGITLDAARVVLELLSADLVVSGTVRDFAEPATAEGVPVVSFSTLMLDRANSELVWQASSFHRGDEGVYLFDAGRVASAAELSCRMAASAIDGIFGHGAKPTDEVQKMRAAAAR